MKSPFDKSFLRSAAVGLVALSVSFPIALISLAKFCAVALAVWLLARTCRSCKNECIASGGREQPGTGVMAWHGWPTAEKLIFCAIGWFSLSALWSWGNADEVFKSLLQHGNLLLLPLLLGLMQNQRQLRLALLAFGAGQVFLLASSWLLFAGMALPWFMAKDLGPNYAVFSSYLDQSTMMALLAALAWHLRSLLPLWARRYVVPVVILLALGCVFIVFPGRTGHVIGVVLVSLALVWELPTRWRMGALLVPVLVVGVVASVSPQVHYRFAMVRSEVQQFVQAPEHKTSSGVRLDYWQSSLKSIAQRPVLGFGAGGWNQAYDALQIRGPDFVPVSANPHQEFLLWGVELGVGGVLLLLAILVSLYRESLAFAQSARRAQQSVLAAVFTACLFNCSLYDALSGDYLCVALGLVRCWGYRVCPAADQSHRST